MSSAEGLAAGSVFADRYTVVRRLGSGGMGAVYEVMHHETRRKRALKVLLPILVSDPDARQRFAQEATITAELESEHLVETFDAGIDRVSGCPFLVMELLRGESLGSFLASGRRLSPPQVLDILQQVARTLDRTHAAGIIHRDIKPDNLFLTNREDGTLRVKVLDFGIAKLTQLASKSRNTVNIGTPLYMAPEQLEGARLDHACDLFSLAHVAFELLTAESYWEPELRRVQNTLALLKVMEGPLPEPPSVRAARLGAQCAPAFDAWFLRATARQPATRYPSAAALVEAFTIAIGASPHVQYVGAPLVLTQQTVPSERGGGTFRGLASSPGFTEESTEDRATAPRSAPLTADLMTWKRARMSAGQRIRRWLTIGVAIGLSLIGVLLLVFLVPKTSEGPTAATSARAIAESAGPAPVEVVTTSPETTSSETTSSLPPATSVSVRKATAQPSGKSSAPPVKKPLTREEICRAHPERCM